jgi:hypothetical protein
VWWLANCDLEEWGKEYIGVCKRGLILLWCFSVVAIRTKRWTECNAGWGGCPVDFYRCCHLTKIRSSIPTREAVDANHPQFSKLDSRMSL